MAENKTTLAHDSDWEVLRRKKATTVIDPMVVRVADLFARGASGGNRQTWDVIKNNMVGLATFVDALILEPGIPVFDYWFTGEGWGKDLPLFKYTSPVVVPVGVESEVWGPLGGEVAIAMGQKPPLPEGVAAETAANLRRIRWGFIPRNFGGNDLSETRTAGDPSSESLVNSYLYVALLFARYAAQLSDRTGPGTQILSPGQSRIFIATAAYERVKGPKPLPEGAVFGNIEDIINESRPGYERTWRSDQLHFLPYLLALEDKKGNRKIRTPADLFREALALRKRGDVSDYRNRLKKAQTRLEAGNDDSDWSEELLHAKNAVQAALNVKQRTTVLHLDIVPPRAGADHEVDPSPLRNWLLSAWPGKRYRRVLPHLVRAQAAGKQIDRGLEMIWSAG
jgi:hypothetical protein